MNNDGLNYMLQTNSLGNSLIDIDSTNIFVDSANKQTKANSRKLKHTIYWIFVMLICSIISSHKLLE